MAGFEGVLATRRFGYGFCWLPVSALGLALTWQARICFHHSCESDLFQVTPRAQGCTYVCVPRVLVGETLDKFRPTPYGDAKAYGPTTSACMINENTPVASLPPSKPFGRLFAPFCQQRLAAPSRVSPLLVACCALCPLSGLFGSVVLQRTLLFDLQRCHTYGAHFSVCFIYFSYRSTPGGSDFSFKGLLISLKHVIVGTTSGMKTIIATWRSTKLNRRRSRMHTAESDYHGAPQPIDRTLPTL